MAKETVGKIVSDGEGYTSLKKAIEQSQDAEQLKSLKTINDIINNKNINFGDIFDLLSTDGVSKNIYTQYSETYTQSDLLKILKDTNPIAILLDKLRQTSPTDAKTANMAYSPERFKKMMLQVTAIAQEMYLHPFVVLKYVLQTYKSEVKKLNEKSREENRILSINLTQIDPKSICPISPDEKSYITIKTEKEPEFPDSYVIDPQVLSSKIERHQWGIKAIDCNTGLNESWQDYIERIESKMYFMYTAGEESVANRLYSLLQQSATEEYKKRKLNEYQNKGKETSWSLPTKLHAKIFMTTPKSGLLNVQNLIIIEKNNPNVKGGRKDVLDPLEKIANQLRNNLEGPKYNVVMFLQSIAPMDTIFDAGIGQQNILQGYCYRSIKAPGDEGQFNPGWPTVWDNNFMDIISFDPTYDYYNGVQSLYENADTVMQSIESPEITLTDLNKEAKNLENRLNDIIKQKEKDKVDQAQIIQIEDEIKRYEKKASETIATLNSAYTNKNPKSFPIDFKKRDIYSGPEGEMLAMKKQLQEFRKDLILKGLQINATMQILGDASFELYDVQKSIFLKFINNDGSMGIFTGLYQVNKIIQEISAGRFVTTFELTHYPFNGENEDFVELSKLWTHQDNLLLNKI